MKYINNNNNNQQNNKRDKIVNNVSQYRNGKSVIRNKKEVFSPLIFEEINYKLSASQSLTDVDGQFEYNRNVFIIESKTHFNSINAGQLLSLLNTAYNTYKSGKIAQVVYRVEMRDEAGNILVDKNCKKIFSYIVFGSKQFKQLENNEEIVPYYIFNKTNDWLADRLAKFEEECNKNWDAETKVRNSRVFSLPNKLKQEMLNAQNEARQHFDAVI